MITISHVAYAILKRYGKMNINRLQLLSYYCQAYNLASTNSPLFYNNFQAWRNGPVCLDLFKMHRINDVFIECKDIVLGPYELKNHLTYSNLLTIYNVCDALIDFSIEELENRARSEMPWIDARRGILPDKTNEVEISKKIIHDYYVKHPVINTNSRTTRSKEFKEADKDLQKDIQDIISEQIEKFNQYNQDEKVRRIRQAEKILREKLSILNGLKNNKIYFDENIVRITARHFVDYINNDVNDKNKNKNK